LYAKYGDKVDIVVVEDLVKGDFTDALKGVSAVIHVATPIPGREELKDILEVGHLPAHFPISDLHRRSRSPGRERSTLFARPSPPVSNISPSLELLAPYGFVQPGD
jgi:hypothetical protein